MSDFATLYFVGELPDAKRLEAFPSAIEIKNCSKNSDEKSIETQFERFSIRFNFMPQNAIRSHLQGLSKFVLAQHFDKHSPVTEPLLDRIDHVTQVVGCVISPGFDKEGYVAGALTGMLLGGNAFMFARDCIFDSDGEILVGAAASH